MAKGPPGQRPHRAAPRARSIGFRRYGPLAGSRWGPNGGPARFGARPLFMGNRRKPYFYRVCGVGAEANLGLDFLCTILNTTGTNIRVAIVAKINPPIT